MAAKHKKGDIVYVDFEGEIGLVKSTVLVVAKSGKLEIEPEGYEPIEVIPDDPKSYTIYGEDEVSLDATETEEEEVEKSSAKSKKEKAKEKDKELTKNIDSALSTDLDSALDKNLKAKMGSAKEADEISVGDEVDEALKSSGEVEEEVEEEVEVDFDAMSRKEMIAFVKDNELSIDYGDLDEEELRATLYELFAEEPEAEEATVLEEVAELASAIKEKLAELSVLINQL